MKEVVRAMHLVRLSNSAGNLDELRDKQLRSLYTIASNLGNKMEELELQVQDLKLDIVGITKKWQNSDHKWNTGIEGYAVLEIEIKVQISLNINDALVYKQVRMDSTNKICLSQHHLGKGL